MVVAIVRGRRRAVRWFQGRGCSDGGDGVRCESSRTQIRHLFSYALEQYQADTGRLPSYAQGLDALLRPMGVSGWRGPYLDRPVPLDPWGHAYVYRRNLLNYDLFSHGPDGLAGTADDVW